MKKLFSFIFAACMAVTAFAAEEVSTCPAGTLADGKVTHELECCTIVQEQGESTTALKSVSPWQAPPKSIMTITPKAGVSIEQFSVNTKNTTLATYLGNAELTNATKVKTANTIVTFAVTDPTQPVVIKFVSATIKFAELTITYTASAVTPDPEQPGDSIVTPDPEPETGVTYNVTVPTGTNACYIAGEMNGWSFTEMTKVDDTHYTITIETATKADGYKYASGADWKYVEKSATGEELGNRVWSENDVVATWAAVYVPEVTPDPEPVAETWTVVGAEGLMGTGWDLNKKDNDMALQADGTYKLVKENLTLAVSNYEYKAAKDRGWTVSVPQSGNQTLKIAKAGKYTVTFVLDINAKTLTATPTLQEEFEVIPSIAIAGDMNGWNTTANTFTMAADKKTASLALNLEAKNYGFKMIIAGSWTNDGQVITRENNSAVYTGADVKDNGTLTADVAGEYTFTWTYATRTLVVTYPALAPDPEQPGDTTVTPTPDPETGVTYNVTVPTGTNACYIAGEMNGWSFTEMTKVDDTHYTITIETATKADGYKYASGADWKYVEKSATGEELGNRVWSENDVVATWAAVYVPETVGFENIEATENAVKFIENGKLYIIREGNIYNATGARVK